MKANRVGGLGPVVDQDIPGGDATGPQGLTGGVGHHSCASSMPSAISEFQNKLFHGPEFAVDLTFLISVLWL